MSSVQYHGELSPVPREWARTIRRPSRQSSSSDSTTTMKILFLCTAHNSLSQQLFLALRQTHSVTIEYAVSDSVMIEAAALAQPDLIICPFLTARVPDEVHTNYLTLIVHPGPPGDSGPSAIDWVLMGDDGSVSDSGQLLERRIWSQTGRSHWGVTVLQATAEFDAGPIWAFEQFELDIDAPGVTKSTLYRGPVTRAAIKATLAALDRIVAAARWPTPHDTYTSPSPAGLERNHLSAMLHQGLPMLPSCSSTDPISIAYESGISPKLLAEPVYSVASVTQHLPFLGGATHRRPLLKASHRDFNIGSDNARAISRRIRSADSQPGCLTKLFGGISLYVYGGTIEEGPGLVEGIAAGCIIACKDGAVCIATCDALGIWITHVRRVKRKVDPMLWPKVPAVSGLRALGLLDDATLTRTLKSHLTTDWTKARYSTHQEIWVDFATYSYPHSRRVALVYFEFYNGAMSTDQCSRLIEALEFVSSTHTEGNPLNAVVLMGGSSYFSNGIALNVVEASDDPATESWRNINRIDDVIHVLLDGFPRQNIMTVAAIRGNCAAGGVAMATACDVVIAGSETVFNPAYRALGLHGSEYHSLSYLGRCGTTGSKHLLRDMLPLSPYEARDIGLIDHTLPGWGNLLDTRIRNHIRAMVCSPSFHYVPGRWKAGLDVSPAGLAAARTEELAEMAKDFWSARSERYHSRRRDFVRKVKALRTPLRFASHRRRGEQVDEEESDAFDDIALFECRALDKMVPARTVEMETQTRQRASLPPSPPSNRGQVDCCSRDLMALPPLLIMEDKSRRDSGLVFPCLYDQLD